MIFFFFNDTATTEIYTLSLHDALPISSRSAGGRTPGSSGRPSQSAMTRTGASLPRRPGWRTAAWKSPARWTRSEEHTSELQSRQYLVCRLLLEKKKKQIIYYFIARAD